MIQRYTMDYNSYTTDNSNGEWVMTKDVKKLEAENTRLKKENTLLKDKMHGILKDITKLSKGRILFEDNKG